MMLPQEFMASEEEELFPDESEAPRLVFDVQQAVFDKLDESKHRHLRALYLKGFVNRMPMGKMMVDGGAAVKIMPITTARKLGKSKED